MELHELKAITTNIPAIDWMIKQGTLEDASHADIIEYECNFIGTLPSSMASEVRKATNANGSIVLQDTEECTIMIAAVFSKYKSSRNKVHFTLSYTALK